MNLQDLDLTNKQAIFVDVDDTLALTMGAHNKAYELAFNLNDVPFSIEDHKKYAPMGGDILIQKTILSKGFSHDVALEIVNDKQKLLPACLDKFMEPNKELIKLIWDLGEKSIPTVAVSNGRRKSVTQILERLGILYGVAGIVCKEDYENAKPNPDPYLKALEMLDLKPDEVIVFEDNEIGCRAAADAGIDCIVKVTWEEDEDE